MSMIVIPILATIHKFENGTFWYTFGKIAGERMKIEEAILYCLATQNRRTSESRIKLACILPSEEEEDEVKCLLRQKDGLC